MRPNFAVKLFGTLKKQNAKEFMIRVTKISTDQRDDCAFGRQLRRVKQIPNEPIDAAMVGIATEIVLRHCVFLTTSNTALSRHTHTQSASQAAARSA